MLYTLVVLSLLSAGVAYPDGARYCNTTFNSICGADLTWRNIENATIESAGYITTLAGIVLTSNIHDPTFANVFQFGQENILLVKSGVGSYLKGIHVIATGGYNTDANILDTSTPVALTITDWSRTKVVAGCKEVALSAVTHKDPTKKDSVAMSFKWPTVGQRLFLNISIIRNHQEGYFTQYPMIAGAVVMETTSCGFFRLNLFCPLTSCGVLGRLLGLCNI